jgi:hypothetical protein
MHRWIRSLSAGVLAGLTLCLAGAAAARAEGWGTIKGQVVWGGAQLPERAKLDVNKDQMACLKNGPLFSEKYVVDPRTRGVRWVVLFLTDPEKAGKPIPVHPRLKEIGKATVEMDQPCCMFEPHTVALRVGQTLVVKNSADISHNVHLTSSSPGPNLNQIVPPGRQLKVEATSSLVTPISIKCDIHGWMQGYAFFVAHPYFAVTGEDGKFVIKNAPAGKYRLVGWQDEGWVIGETKPAKKGKLITITADEVTDLGKITLKP